MATITVTGIGIAAGRRPTRSVELYKAAEAQRIVETRLPPRADVTFQIVVNRIYG